MKYLPSSSCIASVWQRQSVGYAILFWSTRTSWKFKTDCWSLYSSRIRFGVLTAIECRSRIPIDN